VQRRDTEAHLLREGELREKKEKTTKEGAAV
jgi:hypothetical protein